MIFVRSWCHGVVDVARQSVIEQLRHASLRQLTVSWLAYVVVLGAVALVASAPGDRVPTTLPVIAAIAIAAWPLIRTQHLDGDLARRPWLPVLAALAGSAGLVAGAEASTTMFSAFLTPVAICVLFGLWRWGIVAAGILIGGYAAASVQASPALEGALSEPVTMVGAIFIGIGPVRAAVSALDARATNLARWRAGPPDPAAPRTAPGRPGMAGEHDDAILDGVLAGKSDKIIAFELGMGNARWRVRYRRRHLEREHGARDRRDLARLLHDRSVTDA